MSFAERYSAKNDLWLQNSFLQECDEWRIRFLRRFEVWNVSEAGDQMQSGVAVWNGIGDELHTLFEQFGGTRQAVFGASKDESRRFDVCPVIHDRIEGQ